MSKDEALQKAKIYFTQKGHEKMLPYFWANMILMGDSEPVDLNTQNNKWWFIAAAVATIASLVIIFWLIFKKSTPRKISG